MSEILSRYLPEKKPEVEVELREELAPVVERIGKVLPPELIWKMYSSFPGETGGKILFPYCRVDTSVIISRDLVDKLILDGDKYNREEYQEKYNAACQQAFEALVWVEVGFQGLENLARNRFSTYWTAGLGHFIDDEQRVQGILKEGREFYEDCLRRFVSFRKNANIKQDLFSEHGLGYLLDKFK
jgi:hypothetical protein